VHNLFHHAENITLGVVKSISIVSPILREASHWDGAMF
jgi:hypothetical protein